jgi:hypothetical protein
MIYYLVTKPGDHTFRDNLIVVDDPRLRDRFKIVIYQDAFEQRRWRGGTVIFSDIDRLPAAAAMRAAILHERLAQSGAIRLLNHPTRSCRRFGFLRRLKRAGINRHDVFRVDELPASMKFPVFLRSETEHDGAYTELLHDEATLMREIDRLVGQGTLPQNLLISEYCHTADADGVWRKATGYHIGDTVFQRYLFFGDHWQVKQPRTGTVASIRDEAVMLTEEEAYATGDAYVPMIREAARIGEFGFGRMDFDIGGGRPEIWEFNTNPVPAVASFSAQGGRSARIIPRGWQQLRDALAKLDDDALHATTVEIEPVARYEDLYRTMLHDARERAGLPPPE